MRKLWKKALAGLLVAGMMLTPVAGRGIEIAFAEDAADGSVVYDFTDGSIIPTDTDGKKDVTSGNLTVKVGTQNAYKYNGAQHGVEFKIGNTIENVSQFELFVTNKLVTRIQVAPRGDCHIFGATATTGNTFVNARATT